jgi:hypothetical protein
MTKPQRLVLTRRKGFDLQAMSLALNGLPVQTVSRPGKWGNPFTIPDMQEAYGLDAVEGQARAIAMYKRWVAGEAGLADKAPPTREVIVAELAGKNLACWCKAGTPCHADVLIGLANG